MSYQLLGSLRSPFVRFIRLLMIQNSIPFDFEIVNYLEVEADEKRLAAENPINKIPILIATGQKAGQTERQKIFDSRVIANF